ncbi:UDP-N-acetylmuramyl pentapeptide phosphotransferase/UDP-N-acetylglucosamine-1-phosphate transferase [Ekhidna lutea]|uniref:UDP-N-acetylmuramyl pentapeptide phosphotransferase/UDP-N-acetylglucosamine-1-phosphate transferase n=1 Tax=Ekhidna lutea TaxID=447679 RepID=A0A239FJU9_EKHLU|nr:MraY family glycosyltransferase [Ekhidna lutea]SNS56573.1 UDP-N-acetylmuramyl pentapeptide phosphotransferase/UDP-N-acetylglucosamine-1-phosphate transferase [Ekhidna lutea]
MGLPLAIATSFLVTLTLMPVIIKVFKSIGLLDRPDKRKIHSISTPSLGGIAIFSGILMAVLMAVPLAELAIEKYFIGGAILIFLLGVRDDLSSLLAHHKLVVQIFSAFMVVYFGGIQINGLNGLFGVHSFPWHFDEIFTIFIIVVMTNAFNLIDGIDGLAGSIAFVIATFLGWASIQSGYFIDATFAFAIAGASLAFLLYNWFPSKVFMGDTGSMVFGFMLTVLMVKFLATPIPPSVILSPVATSLALFVLPVYDTLRVFFIRFYTGRPPLAPDRNHIHHVLLKLGLNHAYSTLLLVGYNVLVVTMAVVFQSVGELWLMLIMTTMTVTIGAVLDRKLMKREATRLASLIPPEIKLSKEHTSV